jgi:hypothetical protein
VFCGVDDEMQILADTGCYADFTLPSAPDLAQTAKINSVYECSLPLDRPAPHRRGRNLRRGCTPANFPLIIQGPLMLRFNGEVLPRIENSELSRRNPPTVDRFRLWCQAAIGVDGHPDWVFVKVHCHGLDERDLPVMHGTTIQRFLSELTALSRETKLFQVHFATARQLTNMVLAACDGRDGNPASYHDYRLKPITRQPAHA